MITQKLSRVALVLIAWMGAWLTWGPSVAAQMIIEDARGEGPPVLTGAPAFLGSARLSTSDKIAKLAFIRRTSESPLYWGFDASTEINNGLGSVLKTGDIIPGASANLYLVHMMADFQPGATARWIYGRAGFTGSRIVLADPAAEFGKQLTKQTFTGFAATIGANYLTGLFSGDGILGISAGYRRDNNYADLSEVEVELETTSTDATGSTRTITRKDAARRGEYKELDTYPVGADIIWYPVATEPLALSLYSRSVISSEKPVHSLGGGIHVLKKGSPAQVTATLGIEYRDLFDRQLDKREVDHLRIILSIGLPNFFR